MFTSEEVEALFYIRKARQQLASNVPAWAEDMLQAARLVGASRVEELGETEWANIHTEPVVCGGCGDLGIHINDDGNRFLCPEAELLLNDTPAMTCDTCGAKPDTFIESLSSPICGDCHHPMSH